MSLKRINRLMLDSRKYKWKCFDLCSPISIKKINKQSKCFEMSGSLLRQLRYYSFVLSSLLWISVLIFYSKCYEGKGAFMYLWFSFVRIINLSKWNLLNSGSCHYVEKLFHL